MVDHPRQGRAPAPSGQAETAAAPEGERVAKALARAGVASRREVERLIAEGRVALNGTVLTTPAVKVGPGDLLTVNGELVGEREPTRLWRYHKPVGLVTTHKDPQGRPTVFERLPEGLPRVISIGRLDLSSEGLLLLTNDGDLARALELPSSGWVRRYRARAFGRTDQAALDRLKEGITVEGVAYGPIEARLDKAQWPGGARAGEDRRGPANVWITVSLSEGKNREVRRVLEALGLKVNRLIRLAYGPFVLGDLEAGAAQEIGPRVIREQLAGLVAPEAMPTGTRAAAPVAAAAPAQTRRGGGPRERASASGPPRGTRGRASESPSPSASSAYPRESGDPGFFPAGPRPQPKRAAPPPEAEPERMTYKPGWAKPKHKASPHKGAGGPKGGGKTSEGGRAAGPRSSPAKSQGPRVRGDERSGREAEGAKASKPRPERVRPSAATSEAPSRAGPKAPRAPGAPRPRSPTKGGGRPR